MNKIKEMNSIFVFRGHNFVNSNFPLLDWIYSQCNSNHIRIIDKFWLGPWLFNYLNYCNRILWDLHYKNENGRKFLYL
jgi:hypothetical protein